MDRALALAVRLLLEAVPARQTTEEELQYDARLVLSAWRFVPWLSNGSTWITFQESSSTPDWIVETEAMGPTRLSRFLSAVGRLSGASVSPSAARLRFKEVVCARIEV